MEFITCDVCRDGSCVVCGGNGGWEISAVPPYRAKWVHCPNCVGGACPVCGGRVTMENPFADAVAPLPALLPNDVETWEALLFPLA